MTIRYSHPPEEGHDGVFLRDHLEDVAERVRYVVPADARTSAGEPVRDVVETLAYVHDFGKATTYFQQYLGMESGTPPDTRCRYHAPIGAFAAYYALDARGYDTETCLAGFVAVGKHHGTLPDVAEYVFERSHRRDGVSRGTQNANEQQQGAIAMQLQDIDDNTPKLGETVFEKATDGNGSWEEFHDGFLELLGGIESAVAASGTGVGVDRESLSESCYALVLECWGSLVLADKTSAASASKESELSEDTYGPEKPTLERLDEYIDDLEADACADPEGTRSERLNHYRSRAQSTVLENAELFADDGGGVATITLPTGMGKTLAGLSAALTTRDRIGGERIVYALPFTSIIDQVVDEAQDIYETNTAGRLLTAHHHLAETTIRDVDDGGADDADLNDDVAGMLAESWRAGLTVTTFVQLFESLAGPANKQSMKIPALRNSVVVLDEPQSLPLDWWKLVPRLVTMLTERYDATVIAMTATQPQLFDGAVELVDEPTAYFEATERVRYRLDPSTERYIDEQDGAKSYDDAATELLETLEGGDATLTVCNTIDSARKLTELVAERSPRLVDIGEIYAAELEAVGDPETVDPAAVAKRAETAGDRSLLHLSTRLRPIDRLTLIEAAKELTGRGHPLLTVSTQLVEAGVDISFDRVYRDLAPIDSIVQAAGRCNRSFERDRGEVTVWWLDAPEEQEKTPAEAVYNRGVSLLPVAARTLESVRGDGRFLEETTVAKDAVEKYYEALHQQKNVGKETYASYVDEARGDELEGLSLIDQRNAIDVVVCRTDEERAAVEAIQDAVDRYEFDEVNRQMDDLRTRQVSVPFYSADSKEARELGDLPPVHPKADVRYVDPSRPEFVDFFDPTTGFVVPDNTVERRFL
ncbi:CRISPR-associated endonuclease Cas3'' [Natrialbaceae archaeon AArc-T1-2]|uniref:CRISPR-associated endonuclease Cas3'' n=1 Tax=Natrialbaceae archaeon AArc-T1-2 TaxID=3053904 RepID=UPI00255A946B|nr:CRISPR-associated endonuclease Cas3'' [Natrialbaceae archaeon AArc-T1-2]WIV68814.1 CRISPR-associated endonuclease Cas3'' [Natrialbaceae archaeon AArc-T1-2]